MTSIPLSRIKSLAGVLGRLKLSGRDWERSTEDLRITLSRTAIRDAQSIAYLAGLVVSQTRNNVRVFINWGADSELPTPDALRAFSGLRFRELVRSASPPDNLPVEEGSVSWDSKPDNRSTHWIPLSILQRASFGPDGDPYKVHPVLRGNDARSAATVALTAGGFLTESQLASFRSALFLEVAWNAILHSAGRTAEGWCLFCGTATREETRSRRQFEWAIVDFGCGIAASVGALTGSDQLDFASGTPAAHARAFNAIAELGRRPLTSRTSFPPGGAADGNRGYQHIVRAALSHGGLELHSSGVSALLRTARNQPSWKQVRNYGNEVPSGTLVAGWMRPPRVQEAFVDSGALSRTWPAHASYLSLSRLGKEGEIDLDDLASRVRATAKPGCRLVLDLSYAQVSRESLYFAIENAIRHAPASPLVLLGVLDRGRESLLDLCNRLAANSLLPTIAPLVYDRQSRFIVLQTSRVDARLGVATLSPATPTESESDSEPWLTLLRTSNSLYVERGVAQANPDGQDGFYRGRIELFSGSEVGGFFAAGENAYIESARERWASSVAEALYQIAQTDTDSSRFTVLAFSVPVELVARRAIEIVGNSLVIDLVQVRSYEPPSRGEIEASLFRNRPVVLLTDAIVSGAQLSAFASLARRLGAKVVSAVALVAVDKRQLRVDFPVRALAHLSLPPVDETAPVRVLDRVSLAPRMPVPSRPALLSRALSTLAVLRQARATRVGHHNDGNRHSAYFVSTSRLLSGPSRADTIAAIRERLSADASDAPKDFTPSLVVVPQSLALVEGGAAPAATQLEHVEALRRLADALCDVVPRWSSAVRTSLFYAQRYYDSEGTLRTSLPRHLEHKMSGAHILLFDDGFASGHTMRAVVRQALSWGSSRIVVVALLARMTLDDVEWYESFASLRSTCPGEIAPVSFVFPLVLPVPFVTPFECPFERASAEISSVLSAFPRLSSVASPIIASLGGVVADDSARTSFSADADTAIYIRGMLELAAEESSVNNTLRRELLERSATALRGLVSVLATEPRLLLRPRLRSWLPSLLEETVQGVLSDATSDDDLSVRALTAARSALPTRFTRVVEVLADSATLTPATAERAAFQLFTLDDATRSSGESIHAQNKLRTAVLRRAKAGSFGTSAELQQLLSAYALLGQMRNVTAITDTDPPEDVTVALERCLHWLEDSRIHNIAGCALNIAGSAWVAWDSPRVRALFEQRWFPHASNFEQLALPDFRALAGFVRQFLAEEASSRTGHGRSSDAPSQSVQAQVPNPALADTEYVASLLSNVTVCLAACIERPAPSSPSHAFAAGQAKEMASAFHEHLFAKHSHLRMFARTLVTLSVRDVLARAVEMLREYVPEPCECQSPSMESLADLAEHKVLLTPALLLQVIQATAQNVADAAQKYAHTGTIGVLIGCAPSDRGVVVSFLDNVASGQHQRMGLHSRVLSERLEVIGGEFATDRRPEGVVAPAAGGYGDHQWLTLRFAPHSLLTLCAR